MHMSPLYRRRVLKHDGLNVSPIAVDAVTFRGELVA